MGGGMEANKNKFIEEWGSVRENLEQNFRWTRRNFALIGIFGVALPFLVYKGVVREFSARRKQEEELAKQIVESDAAAQKRHEEMVEALTKIAKNTEHKRAYAR